MGAFSVGENQVASAKYYEAHSRLVVWLNLFCNPFCHTEG